MRIDDKGRQWYKGNLHMHTRMSDGQMEPGAAIELYKSKGYDFIARTEHWKVSPADEYEGILTLSGCEYNIGGTPAEGIFHIVAIGMDADPLLPRPTADKPLTGQAIVNAIHSQNGLAVIAHPAWSLNTPEQILSIHRDTPFDMTEIFNSTSDLPRNCRPYSGLITDMLASVGTFLPLSACDDVHWYNGDQCRSFIWVHAEACTKDAILSAIRSGDFIASQGPLVDARREGDRIVVDCDPSVEIVFFTDSVWTDHRADIGVALTHAEYAIKPNDTFVRVEIKDHEGKYAWSQYIRVK